MRSSTTWARGAPRGAGAPRGLPRPVAHRGARRDLPGAAGRGHRLVHPPGRPRRRPGARHEEPRPRGDRARWTPTSSSPTRRRTASSTCAAAGARGRRLGDRHRDRAAGAGLDAAGVRRGAGAADEPAWLAQAAQAWSGPSPTRTAAPSSRSGATRGWSWAGRPSPPTCSRAARPRGGHRAGRRGGTPGRRGRPGRPAAADVVLLPDEPYEFTADDGPEAFVRVPTGSFGPAAHLVRARPGGLADFAGPSVTMYRLRRPAGRIPPVAPAPLAQSAERFHGKEKVVGSIPTGGSVRPGQVRETGPVVPPRRGSSAG